MKNIIELNLRAFPVELKDTRTGGLLSEIYVVDKATLQAAGAFAMDSTELIHRHYNRLGYRVLEVGKPARKTVSLDLAELFQSQET